MDCCMSYWPVSTTSATWFTDLFVFADQTKSVVDTVADLLTCWAYQVRIPLPFSAGAKVPYCPQVAFAITLPLGGAIFKQP